MRIEAVIVGMGCWCGQWWWEYGEDKDTIMGMRCGWGQNSFRVNLYCER